MDAEGLDLPPQFIALIWMVRLPNLASLRRTDFGGVLITVTVNYQSQSPLSLWIRG